MTGWIAACAAGLITSALLWFPSGAIGIATFTLLGRPTYLTVGAVAPFVGVSLLLLALPALLLSVAAIRIGLRRAVPVAGLLVVAWQGCWVLIALLSGNDELLGWPFFAMPVELEPWDPSTILATGLATVGVVAAAITWFAIRPVNADGPDARSLA